MIRSTDLTKMQEHVPTYSRFVFFLFILLVFKFYISLLLIKYIHYKTIYFKLGNPQLILVSNIWRKTFRQVHFQMNTFSSFYMNLDNIFSILIYVCKQDKMYTNHSVKILYLHLSSSQLSEEDLPEEFPHQNHKHKCLKIQNLKKMFNNWGCKSIMHD